MKYRTERKDTAQLKDIAQYGLVCFAILLPLFGCTDRAPIKDRFQITGGITKPAGIYGDIEAYFMNEILTFSIQIYIILFLFSQKEFNYNFEFLQPSYALR